VNERAAAAKSLEAEAQSSRTIGSQLRRLATQRLGALRGGGLFIGILVVFAVFGVMNPAFVSVDSVVGVLRYMSSVALMGLGFMLVLIVGELDISFGYVYGLTATVIAVAWMLWGWPVYAALIAAVLVASLVGLFNAAITTLLKIPSFIVTLGSGALAYGTNLYIGNSGSYNPNYPPPHQSIDPGQLSFFNHIAGVEFIPGVPTQVLWTAVFALIFYVVVHRSLFGFRLLAIGGNPAAARLARLPVTRYKFVAFVGCSIMAAVASILDFSFISSTEPNGGQSFLFPVIAGVIIGGASLTGGKGTVWGTIAGAFLLSLLSIGLAFVAAGPFAQQIFLGGVIIVAVALDRLTNRR
jgi:ribose/xylose/arabinose/galactoside ABC-type transport system permease subunit